MLAVGRQAFLERPYETVSLDEVAAEAGVSHGLVFHYFSTKRDFYREVMRSFLEERVVAAHLDPELSPEERLHAGLDEHLRVVEEHATDYRLLIHGGPGTDDEVHRMLEEFRRRGVERILTAAGAEDPSPRLRIAVRGWVSFVEGCVLEWLDRRELDRETLLEVLGGMLLAAFEAGGAPRQAASRRKSRSARSTPSRGCSSSNSTR